MKKLTTLLLVFLAIAGNVAAQGVAIAKIDSAHNSFTSFHLKKSSTSVSINNQIATTTTTQLFINNTTDTSGFNFGFPMPETAAATRIRWNYTGQWQTASLISAPQDSTFNADFNTTTIFTPAALDTFLGTSPLYFPVDIQMAPGDNIFIELTYVELLPYQNNYVSWQYPGRYNLIQSTIDSVLFDISISSYRLIDSVLPLTYSGWTKNLNSTSATASLALSNISASSHFRLNYLLHPDSLGFFAFSTFYPDSIEMCDTTNGFFTFIVEPNSVDESDIIAKDFVLIIDHSGSMSGTKMTQANQAATFIINNLNVGDRFNIVQFDNIAESFSTGFVDYTSTNKNAALNYINGIAASGSTNISGSFDMAVPMFANSGASRAKIIIFFTDGEPTAGITNTTQLVAHVTNLINATAPDISLYVFGIGASVNNQLLTQLAVQNNGACEFLTTTNVNIAISNFYLTIQSPVLLAPTVSYNPPIVSEAYPNPLPNLYKGQQLIISGRYNVPGSVTVTLSGTAFGNPVSYQYAMLLTDSLEEQNNFLPKIWAKSKIDSLTTEYYLNQNNQNLAMQLKEHIANLSMCRGVISPFTSFSAANNNGGGGPFVDVEDIAPEEVILLPIYPNPAKGVFFITLPADIQQQSVVLKITSIDGKLMQEITASIGPDGKIELDAQKLGLEKGIYMIAIEAGGKKFRSKLLVF